MKKKFVKKGLEIQQSEKNTENRTAWSWFKISIMLVLFDILASNLAYAFGLWLRFDFKYTQIPKELLFTWIKMIPIQSCLILGLFAACHLYRSIWKYASTEEVEYIALATSLAGALHMAITLWLFVRMPISYYFIGWMMEFILLTAIRYSYRFLRSMDRKLGKNDEFRQNVMLIGAGEAGRLLIKELRNSDKLAVNIKCVIDDDSAKVGKIINGVPIVGGRDDILSSVEKYKIQKIIVAIPSATASARRDILNVCKETTCELQMLPGVYQLVKGEVKVSHLKKVSVEELLGREPIKVNMDEILGYVRGKVIMITGGGGSIGSELCRQIMSNQPKQLIIFDIYENNAYEIQQELKRKYPYIDLQVLIGSVRDTRRVNQIFAKYHPDIVYHAAAHKHVPLMEYSPNEAIKNNVLGTYKVASAATRYGVKRFVLISTDKAVNPTNIMGASKRLCEMVVQALGHNSATEYVAVRFGNVLGSNGSVIPLFKKQIEAGGPVTVTHPDIIRYFMTIPEAVSLVLQAGAYAKGGEIFVLDMGEPVKIDDLARNLIKLSGYVPDEEIEISYTGLREGEKMYEECLKAEEGLEKTQNQLIFIGKPLDFDREQFFKDIELLKQACYDNADNIKEIVEQIVPSYHGEHVTEEEKKSSCNHMEIVRKNELPEEKKDEIEHTHQAECIA
ncbi:MAG: nucleoside-diphosphate sugar epimerase/dehydratase [Lachnospiraceae bacterium]